MVFQIRDDVLNVAATDGQLQKPAGQDLAEGVYTLPALVALANPTRGLTCGRCSERPWPNPNATRPGPS